MRTSAASRGFKRAGVIAAAALVPFAVVNNAWAGERESYIVQALPGFESQRWTDDGGTGVTKVEFTKCTVNNGYTTFSSTHVQLWEHIKAWPDEQRGSTRKYTACKTGTSVGEFPAMTKGDVSYFRISQINGGTGVIHLDVSKVRVAH